MIPRRNTLIALIVAAAFSPLGAVLAQSTTSDGSVGTTTTATQVSSVIPTATASPTTVSESASTPIPSSATPSASSTDGLDYYPSTPGQSYDDPNQLIDETEQESDAGADGTSDTFINIPLGAQIGIISVVVIVGISGLVASYLWYMRRRKQWELQGRRRSLIPRILVNKRGELTMSRPIITRKPTAPPTPSGMRPGSTNSITTFLPVDLEKGGQKSEFETDPKAGGGGSMWKKLFSRK